MTTITGQHEEIIERALELVAKQQKPTPATITYQDGTSREARLAVSSTGALMRMRARSRRYGAILWRDCKPIQSIRLKIPTTKTKTPSEAYANDLRRLQSYFNRHSDPRIWDDYRADLDAIDAKALATLEKANCPTRYEAWKLAGDLGLPKIERFKTTTLRTCEAPDRVIAGVRQSIGHEDFSYHWRGKYDYSVSGRRGDDGIYRAWLSQEYKGCGNGHYYLLISAEKAVFCEDD